MDVETILSSFWDASVRHEVQPPLTDEMIAHARSVLGVQLPAAYLALLRIDNDLEAETQLAPDWATFLEALMPTPEDPSEVEIDIEGAEIWIAPGFAGELKAAGEVSPAWEPPTGST